MMQSPSLITFRRLAFLAGLPIAPLRAAQKTELKDEAGKTILKYVIEVRPAIAPAGTNGQGIDPNPAIANKWAKVIGEPVRAPRTTPAPGRK